MKKRKNIALFVAMIENQFSYAICEGALMGAEESDVNLFIFPGGIINAKYEDKDANCYRYQYNTLFSCVESQAFDAVIIEYGTVTSFLNEKEKKEFLAGFGDVPIILLAGTEEGYSSVCVDNQAGLREAILHLIDQHGCDKIGFVSGPKTSQDALERLDVFQRTVEEKGLDLGEDWIVYGNFSEYCEDVVTDLMERHPDIQAIVCANDQMASGAYNVIRRFGKQPGVDILVTGFDDSPTAMLLDPKLTSVRADTKELAYMAVQESAKLEKGQIVECQLNSRLIARESCGCLNGSVFGTQLLSLEGRTLDAEFMKQLAQVTYETNFDRCFVNEENDRVKQLIEDYFLYFYGCISETGDFLFDHEEFLSQYKRLSETMKKGYIEMNRFLSINYMLYNYLRDLIAKDMDRLLLIEEIAQMNLACLNYYANNQVTDKEKVKIFEVMLTNITRDMLQFSDIEEQKYYSVFEKFQRMEFDSCYIYAYKESVEHGPKAKWKHPKQLYLKGYFNQGKIDIQNRETVVSFKELFVSDVMPNERRHDMLVMPLFSGYDLYGYMMTESCIDSYRYASQIACQVGVAINVMEIRKRQEAITKKLERSLAKMERNNKILDEMSHKDPLTGIANRRGFLDSVNTIITDKKNHGKRAIAVYADMDCLKIVNDEFGHDEGDFALKTIATALTESFRKSDVVARMGGDEFAAFAMVSSDHFAEALKKRVNDILLTLNQNDKPYYVNMSIGTYEFVIDEDTNLDHVLNVADENLYLEKRNKVKVVYKNA